MTFDPTEEIEDEKALTLIRRAASARNLIYGRHVKQRMSERNFTIQDILYILQNGRLRGKEYKAEYENWVYSIRGQDLEGEEGRVVTAILSEYSIQIITVTS
ncbi:MAG: DUF4258 domain-containing protein [Desulfobacteraceae bacterium]|nr:DUF4258 domain-containing protein [Desulfobacteraceae bacterium]